MSLGLIDIYIKKILDHQAGDNPAISAWRVDVFPTYTTDGYWLIFLRTWSAGLRLACRSLRNEPGRVHADHAVVAQTTSWFQVVKAQLRKAAQLSPHGTLESEALAGLRTERECES